MHRVQVRVFIGLATLLACALCTDALSVINVPVTTKYITTEVQTVDQDETIVLIGHLCAQSKGMAVNVTVLLNNNPSWEPTFGVLRYYVVDDPNKGVSKALCNNYLKGRAVPNCVVPSWPSSNDIFIKGTAGQSAAISFTVDAEIFPKTSKQAAVVQADVPKYSPKLGLGPPVRRGPVYLTEIVTVSATQELAYHQMAMLNFTFCPTPRTGSRYTVRDTTTDTDGKSSYAQYLCDKLPCEVDGRNVIAHDGRQLPSNTLISPPGQWRTLYALIVCWGGIYEPANDKYIGHYLFNAVQVPA